VAFIDGIKSTARLQARARFTLIVGDPIVTVKCRTAIKTLFLCFNLCQGVMLDSLPYSFTSIVYIVKPVLRGHFWDKEKVSL